MSSAPPEPGLPGKLSILWIAAAVIYTITRDAHVGGALFAASLILAASHLWHGPR